MSRRFRISILLRRRTALGLVWGLTVLAAGGVGWSVSRLGQHPRGPSETGAVSAERGGSDKSAGRRAERASEATPTPPPAVEPAAPPPEPPPSRPEPVRPEPEPPEPSAESIDLGPTPPAAAPAPPELLVRALRASRLAEDGDAFRARREATKVLAAHPSYTGLAAALRDDGADEIRARLTALRVLQIAGHESISREVARELKRSHASTGEVLDSIRQWKILNPRITSLESSIEDGRYVVVTGTVENPDVGDIRRVRVRVEALDAGGNLLGTQEVRVRPKLLPPGGQAVFKASFKKLEPAVVLRTRATIIEWESEVLGAG